MSEITDRINNYLGNGGLFNPEMMEHIKVRDLIMDCRDEIDVLTYKLIAQKAINEHLSKRLNSND